MPEGGPDAAELGYPGLRARRKDRRGWREPVVDESLSQLGPRGPHPWPGRALTGADAATTPATEPEGYEVAKRRVHDLLIERIGRDDPADDDAARDEVG